MEYTICLDCKYCNPKRKNEEGKVRCTRFSQFVSTNQKSCDVFYNEDYYNAKHLALFREMMKGGE